MLEQLEGAYVPTSEAAPIEAAAPVEVPAELSAEAGLNGASHGAAADAGDESRLRHARAGRKGALRVHELIREGRLYEQERGLKRGRQRLRQLIELGRRYEQETGLRPTSPKKSGGRLSRAGRGELLATLLDCLVRIAKPSFRAELLRLVEALSKEETGRDPLA